MKSNKSLLPAIPLVILLVPSPAHANVIWPSLMVESKLLSLPIIIVSLVIEFFAIKRLLKLSIAKAVQLTVIANMISTFAGMFLNPIIGIVYELTLGWVVKSILNCGTFNPIAWTITPILCAIMSTIVELGAIKIIWKTQFTKKIYFWVLIANLITASIATLWVIIFPPEL